MVQGRVPDELRGRIMGVYATMVMGVQPLGALIAGVWPNALARRTRSRHLERSASLGACSSYSRVAMRLGDTQAATEPHAGLGR